MKLDKKILSIMMIGILVCTIISGCIQEKKSEFGSGLIIIPAVSAVSSNNPKYALASYYSSQEVKIESSVSLYDLPLDPELIVNYGNITSAFQISDEQKILLKNNGFFVMDYGDENDTIEPYNNMKKLGIPIFVTADTLLHLYHIQFDEILKGIEQREFFDKILDLSKKLFEKSKTDYEYYDDEDLKEASRRNVAFFGVALSLLQTATEGYDGSEDIKEVSYTIPSYAQDNVSEEGILHCLL